ncbi:hypothetical protein OKA05_24785 [Luteolibacter arcticus]|uniref:DUF3592 domain-containing protein n=1 Tax=Luteolibacter arcticus TaxID=1581411 RepID=A0ABT3GQJ4_9BACT|nr:hypothetical protein [Luteolibacter arcticus]MCW1925798.1 hypothetical protein [Luteolibacter arcticus]
MHLPTLAKYLLVAWMLPVGIVVIARTFSPDPGQSRSDFQSATFTPARIWTTEHQGTRRSDYFELRVQSPAGEFFFHRDPNPEPIQQLGARIPRDRPLALLYQSGHEGNVLMEIADGSPGASTSFLSFSDIMAEYAARRRLVYIVAAIWFTLANLISWALWKAVPNPPATVTDGP